MAYQHQRQCALFLDTDAGPFMEEFDTLALPGEFRAELLALFRHGRPKPELIKQIPIRRFYALLQALAPELVVMNRDLAPEDDTPTIYADKPFPQEVLAALVNAWAVDLQPDPAASGMVRRTLAGLRPADLRWRRVAVDLLEQSLTAGGTAAPAERLYRLLPEVLARRIAAHSPFVMDDVALTFVQGPSTTRGAAELVSWPPRKHQGKRPWYFSVYIRISLHTVPFDPRPRIHLHTGVRRWETGRKVFVPPGDKVSVYLAADAPWLEGAPTQSVHRFSLGRMGWDRGKRRNTWAAGGPEGMLRHLTFNRTFPDPEILIKEPGQWLEGVGGVTAAVLHSTAMDTHGVGAGLMPRDRAPLTKWAADALAPYCRPVADMSRSSLPAVPLNPPLKKRKKKDAEAAEAEHQAALAEAARDRRARLARLLGEPILIANVLYDHEPVRDELVKAAVENLGLQNVAPLVEAEDRVETRIWRAEKFELHLRLTPIGAIGATLAVDGKAPAGRDQWDEAVAARRLIVSERMSAIGAGARLALIEVRRQQQCGPFNDPKQALRLGAADAHLVSQFINPPDGDEDGGLEHRAQAAWQDGLRQLGLSTLPRHSLTGGIPDNLQYAALWIVRKNRSGQTNRAHFLPVAVLMRPERSDVLATMPGLNKWIPYAELLTLIGQDGTGPETWDKQARKAVTAQFLRWMLTTLRGRSTLLLTHAQNGREAWPWLTNSAAVPDRLQLGEARPQRVSLFGPGLRHVRVREGLACESPQCFAPNPKTGIHGLSEGLWLPPGHIPANRVFGSTTAKPDTAQNAAVSASKLVPGPNGHTAASRNAWNPEMLEIAVMALQNGDKAEDWAALTHQLRITPDHRNALKLPLPLHLAQRIAEYVLHTEDKSGN